MEEPEIDSLGNITTYYPQTPPITPISQKSLSDKQEHLDQFPNTPAPSPKIIPILNKNFNIEADKQIKLSNELDKSMSSSIKKPSLIPRPTAKKISQKEIAKSAEPADAQSAGFADEVKKPENDEDVDFSLAKFPEFKDKFPQSIGSSEKPILISYVNNRGEKQVAVYKTKGDFERDNQIFPEKQTKEQKDYFKTLLSKDKKGKGVIIGTFGESIFNKAFAGSNFFIINGKNIPQKLRVASGKLLKDLASYRGKYNSPLFDTELVEMLSPYKLFEGVIMRDELKYLLDKMENEDKDEFGFVMNLDPSTAEGSHWVAIYVDLDEGKHVCYYDSFSSLL